MQLHEPAALLVILREHNVLLFDFVLKRTLAKNGSRFALGVRDATLFQPHSLIRVLLPMLDGAQSIALT